MVTESGDVSHIFERNQHSRCSQIWAQHTFHRTISFKYPAKREFIDPDSGTCVVDDYMPRLHLRLSSMVVDIFARWCDRCLIGSGRTNCWRIFQIWRRGGGCGCSLNWRHALRPDISQSRTHNSTRPLWRSPICTPGVDTKNYTPDLFNGLIGLIGQSQIYWVPADRRIRNALK